MSPLTRTWIRPSTSSSQHYVRTLAITMHGELFICCRVWLIYLNIPQVWPGNLLSENEQDTFSRVSLPQSGGDPPKERSTIRMCRNGVFTVIRSLSETRS